MFWLDKKKKNSINFLKGSIIYKENMFFKLLENWNFLVSRCVYWFLLLTIVRYVGHSIALS